MTELDIARNASAVRNLAERLERLGYEGDRHGAYGYRRGCKCDVCRAGHRERMRQQRERRNPRQPLVFPNPEIRDERVPDRIWTKVHVDANGCWIWTGGRTTNGYGRTKRIGNKHRSVAVHRLVYGQMVGPVPDDLDLDHLCRVRACCNPEHLEPVTRQVNILRGETMPAANAKKTHCKYGHPFSGDNLMIHKNGVRSCVTCNRRRMADRKAAVGMDEWRRRDRERWHEKKRRGAA